MTFDAYLDIETTGIWQAYAELTVVGVALADPQPYHFFQLIGDQITAENLLGILRPAGHIYTYNGARFDLPFIRAKVGLDLRSMFMHTDLMYHCWRRGLKGGLKAVERQLGIARQTADVDGRMAIELWWRYVRGGDTEALGLLLGYNREDVLNLYHLRCRLGL
ncbi:MAG: ribonuclease H-like domain-containing protein [Sedimentisphaerales bacterium]|jgi:uncharacterized protein YprB with RNaseH-like and TPR domain|nr:ribonuclease H-like domain-containing protein [Sedimentisphaerales bacterium]